MKTKRTVSPKRVILLVVLVLIAVIFLVPMYMTIVTSLKRPSEINLLTAWKFPSKPYFASYAQAWELLGPNMRNSLVLTLTATVISAMIGSLNGYIFSKNPFPSSELIFTLLLFGMFIPYQIILIPLFQMLRNLGLYGSLSGLILAHVIYGIPIVTLLFRNFYDQIPTDILESARLDGASFFGIFGRIILPLSLPGFVTVGIWQVTQIWNEFLWGITLTRQESNPVTVGLSQLAGGQAVSWNLPMAGALITALPILIIYVVLGKYFIKGLLSGSVKG